MTSAVSERRIVVGDSTRGDLFVHAVSVEEGTLKVGYGLELLLPLGLLLALPTLLHIIPRTQFFGALLLTAYFGGAVATHVRNGSAPWFPIVFCVILWAAYAMRSVRLRAFLLAVS